MKVGFLGNGAFGAAVGSLVKDNGHEPEFIDVGESFKKSPDVLFVATPVQAMREALSTRQDQLHETKLVINLSKGIEKKTGHLPHQILAEVLGERSYVAVAGPSFAVEILRKVPTVVSVAGTEAEAVGVAKTLLGHPYFLLEESGSILELELAAAMKNIYAIASGYVAGSGGGFNTHAHVQVVALREYTKLIQALEGRSRVVRPGVMGDLILTCCSAESRNYQYGHTLASSKDKLDITAEGVATAEAIMKLAEEREVELPLAAAVMSLIDNDQNAREVLYGAIGFTDLKSVI